jgi:hypothetical protein
MLVRKVRGQNKIGKIILSKTEYEIVRNLGVPIEGFIKHSLIFIAKKRRWKWYLTKENT